MSQRNLRSTRRAFLKRTAALAAVPYIVPGAALGLNSGKMDCFSYLVSNDLGKFVNIIFHLTGNLFQPFYALGKSRLPHCNFGFFCNVERFMSIIDRALRVSGNNCS